MRNANPGEQMPVLIADDWFATSSYAVPGNVHLLSTSAWLDGLEELGMNPSAAELPARIQSAGPKFRADLIVDREAQKVEGGTEWRSKMGRSTG